MPNSSGTARTVPTISGSEPPSALSAGFRIWLLALIGIGLLSVASRAVAANSTPAAPGSSHHARVVTIEDPEATDAFRPRPEIVRAMVFRALTNLTGRATVREAVLSFVSTQDVVGLKVYSPPGPNSGTRPAVVAAFVEGLLEAGLPTNHIVIWDKQSVDLRLAGFYDVAEKYGVRVAGSFQEGYDEKTFYETALLGNLVWGDLEFGKKENGVGRKSFVSKLVSRELTKIINITPMLNHNLVGVTGNLFSLASGSVDNFNRFDSNPDRLATAVPEIYALPALFDHVVLNIVDALVCQYEGGERGLLHYSVALNQLRFSRDPVALDVLSYDELDRQRRLASALTAKPNLELVQNASLLELGVSDLKRIQVEMIHSHEKPADTKWQGLEQGTPGSGAEKTNATESVK